MAFIEGDEPVAGGNPAGFMAYHVSIGTSATGALAEWRDLGLTFTDRQWYAMYGQVTDTLLRTEQAAALEPGVLPSANDYGEWAMGQGDQYATQVNVTYRDEETGLLSLQPFTFVTDEPHTPEEAEAAAMDIYGSDDNAERYGQQILGAFVTHVWITTPFGG